MATTMKNSFSERSPFGTSSTITEMAGPRMMATVLGGVFLLVGLVGLAVPDLLHAHLSAAHNAVHLVSGAMALSIGIWGTMNAARMFDLFFGTVYGLLGIAGFVLGSPGAATVGHAAHDSFLWAVIPGILELGGVDHGIHVIVGLAFLTGACIGFWSQARSSNRAL